MEYSKTKTNEWIKYHTVNPNEFLFKKFVFHETQGIWMEFCKIWLWIFIKNTSYDFLMFH